MSDAPQQPERQPDGKPPPSPGGRIISHVTIILIVLLGVLIWADDPDSTPGDRRFFARLFLKFLIAIVVGVGLFMWWRRRRTRHR